MAVLNGERTAGPAGRRKPRRVKVSIDVDVSDVVVDDEKTGVRVGEKSKPNIRRPQVRSIVVLDERLHEHPRRK